jgi:hypothetical protein
MRQAPGSLKSKLVLVLFSVAFVALLPFILLFILPVAAVQTQLRTRRILKLASEFACVVCGTQLGAEAVRLADERCAKTIADLQARSPGIRFRLVRDIHAICPSCGCEYLYLDTDRSLVRRPPPERARGFNHQLNC